MTYIERKMIREAAREILRKAGYEPGRLHKLRDLIYSAEVHAGLSCAENDTDLFLTQFVREHRRDTVPARVAPAFRPLRLSPQMRINQARAAAHQPSLITPAGWRGADERGAR